MQKIALLAIPLLLAGCGGSKVDIRDCDNSLVWIEQSSEQKTDNEIPISLTDASQALKTLAGLPKAVAPVEPTPVVPTPVEPIVPGPTSNSKTFSLHWNAHHQAMFGWFDDWAGADFGSGPITLTDNCGGEPMVVENPQFAKLTPEGRNYWGGTWESEGKKQQDTLCVDKCWASYFTNRGCKTATEVVVTW